MIRTKDYLALRFERGGRERPFVDCWGLYRLIVGEAKGVWLAEFEGHEAPATIVRTARREAGSPSWLPVRPGEERPFDAVLMSGILGEGRAITLAPIHVGCVVEPGRLIDIEETGGVKVISFRNTTTMRAPPDVTNRVRGIFRPAALA